ncbi:4860_t:CDS:2, partial [Racocetra persica]
KFDDIMKPIVNEIKILEKGTLMNIEGQDMWIVAGLGVITTDLSQDNDLGDMKYYSGSQDKKISKLKELVKRRASQKIINSYCTEHGLSARSKAVHKTFKGSVSKTNCKNIEFDFIHRHNTLQSIHYLINGDKDSHFPSIGSSFQNLTIDSLLKLLLSNWYIIQNIQEEDIADI